MKISFFGHRKLNDLKEIKEKVTVILDEIIKNNTLVEFFCGSYGNFDSVCYSIAKNFKNKNQNIKITFVTPYIDDSYLRNINSNMYDEIVYPPIENSPKRLAIIKRNEWIINESDLIIFYVKNNFGGAYTALQYSKRKNKRIINI